MDCRDALELVTPAIDGKLDAGLKSLLLAHTEKCPTCRNEFELEQITKRVFKEHLNFVKTPGALRARIMSGFDVQATTVPVRRYQIGALLSFPAWRTIASVAVGAAFVLLLLLIPFKPQHSHARPLDGDIVNQTYNNFGEVLKGSIVPAIASEDPSAVKAFVGCEAGFDVHVPRLKHCRLVGGLHTCYNNDNVAHVIYRHKENVIYVYQVRLQAVLDGHNLHVSRQVKDDIDRTGWYFEKQCPGCSLMLWRSDSTLCCAIADMEKSQLLSFFKESE